MAGPNMCTYCRCFLANGQAKKAAGTNNVMPLGLGSPLCDEPAEGKRKGRPKADVQELRNIPAHLIVQWKEEFRRHSRVKCPCSGCWLEFPSIYGVKYHYQRCQGATVGEKLSHSCPYCEAVFATKVRLQKHKLWNHPDRVSVEPRDEETKLQKNPVKFNTKKRPMENSPPSPVFFKVKKTHEVSVPSQNGELAHQRSERKQHSHSQQTQPSQLVQALSQQSHSQSTSSDAGGSESEGGSLPPSFPDEDPERMRHRRKQKTPKKFTGEQPSISGTFGLKGMTKVEEKLKAGRVKRPEGSGFSEEHQKKHAGTPGTIPDAQWHRAISERGEVVCPTCSIVTRKTVHGLKKHMEICQKLQDALKCQQCQKQFRSKAGLNYHTMAEHTIKPSGSEGQTDDIHKERERLRLVLKQMGRIKCPSEGCSSHFSSLMGYQYHQKRCGGDLSDDEKSLFLCQHCGKSYRSKTGRDYHVRTEHSPSNNITMESTKKDNIPDTNNNTGKERVVTAELSSVGKKEQSQSEKKDYHETASFNRPTEKERELRNEEREKGKDREPNRVAQSESPWDDLERTPSGRVRRRSAQVAVFHLQEIAEDELAKDWGTKRRIKDDLVPDSKRLNYTRPGLPNFSPELLESWKNQVKEKGFICCTNENWFRAAATQVAPSSKTKVMENHGMTAEVRNGATSGKKRGRKPKEHPPVAVALQTETEAPSQSSSPAISTSSSSSHASEEIIDPTDSSGQNRQPTLFSARGSKPKRQSFSE
ncbi:hypothetical protein fugu_007205 [Takifugu bimaculatus]|uniref:C2H2-type domain-containing protein n=1 Tax=Takifugu bimaculatus TaxID=433685 RepID=A0A4Z2B4Q4_9TELE|nr:hypothetical protein fugu_007205 [Takifugu bimaculatus]